jgi:peptidoglycan/LPS O-acetylase OafA/YrhL
MASRKVNPSHFSDLDGLRGILAVAVMLYHYGLNTILGATIGITDAPWGFCVDFFFVLSGFVICKSVCTKPISPGDFALKRFFRLFPLHLAILLIFMPVMLERQETTIHTILDLAALSPIVDQPMANGPAWSMGFEFYVPIVLVALIPWSKVGLGMAIAGFTSALVIYSIISFVLAQELQYSTYESFERHARAVTGLLLGFFLWRCLETSKRKPAPGPASTIFLFLAFLFFVLMISSGVYPILASAFPLLFVLTMVFGTVSRGLFSTPAFHLLGRLSFGVYMVHMPVLYAYIYFFGEGRIDGNVLLKASMVFSSFVIAFIFHTAVERPGVRFGSFLMSRRL